MTANRGSCFRCGKKKDRAGCPHTIHCDGCCDCPTRARSPKEFAAAFARAQRFGQAARVAPSAEAARAIGQANLF